MAFVRKLLPLVAVLAVAAPAHAAGAPKLRDVRCVPPTAQACKGGKVRVQVGRSIQLRGTGLKARMRVTFRWPLGALVAKIRRTRAGFIVKVPPGTRAGRVEVYVRDARRRYSNRIRITVTAPPIVRPTPPANRDARLPDAFAGNGMWIWELPKAEGGDLDAIAARARAAGVRAVFVKAADGTKAWTQFSPELVAGLHERGLVACAWQYTYGSAPEAEAAAAATAIQKGADCFVIDAESEYQGRYAQAQRYMTELRRRVGAAYPIGLTTFPYVDYHPALPYSVFLAPGAAQANLPQVYWRDIGDTVDAASAHTFAHNRLYGVPIAPLGQTYQSPPATELDRFRAVWRAYGAGGLSWWSWQHTTAAGWTALGQPEPAAATLPDPGSPVLKRGAKGDEVVWLQMHLASADPSVVIDGTFSSGTDAALRAFQESRGLPVTGATDEATWNQVLALPVKQPDWTAGGRARAASGVTGPPTASLPPKAYEIPPAAGRK